MTELAHAGVKGMKWGVRKSKKETGVSRYGGAKIDQNERLISVVKTAQSGKGYKASAAIGRALIGEKKQRANWEKSIKKLGAQNDRIRRGEATVRDRLDMLQTVSLAELYVSRRPS